MSFNFSLKNLSNIPGWRTDRRIVVFESDDWGSIRMPSNEAFFRLKAQQVDLESFDYTRYNRYDTMADKDDLNSLFDVLGSVSDKNSNPCVFTALSVVANPDFQKIRENGFRQYFYEPFTVTQENYYPGQEILKIWKKGMDAKLFLPQFHGREHLNIVAWMKSLQTGNKKAMAAFDEGVWGYVPERTKGDLIEFQAAFQMTDVSDLEIHKEIIETGLDLFYKIFGYRASYFVPPNGPINNKLNGTLYNNGIRIRSSSKIQQESVGYGKHRIRFHWLGQKDKNGITYVTRNCFFEPSCQSELYGAGACLRSMEYAFKWKKPAVISSHRVNYIGHLNPANRESGLRELKLLLQMMLKRWPDIEFMTTDSLGRLINNHVSRDNA